FGGARTRWVTGDYRLMGDRTKTKKKQVRIGLAKATPGRRETRCENDGLGTDNFLPLDARVNGRPRSRGQTIAWLVLSAAKRNWGISGGLKFQSASCVFFQEIMKSLLLSSPSS